jgi:hypothetical protein
MTPIQLQRDYELETVTYYHFNVVGTNNMFYSRYSSGYWLQSETPINLDKMCNASGEITLSSITSALFIPHTTISSNHCRLYHINLRIGVGRINGCGHCRPSALQ